MADFPAPAPYLDSALHAGFFGSPWGVIPHAGTSNNTAWPNANTAFFFPIRVPWAVTVYKIGVAVGTTASNIDVGIYGWSGDLIVSSGSTAKGTSSVYQLVDIADTALAPGRYWLALANSNNTGGFCLVSTTAGGRAWSVAGVRQMDSAFPLPTTATPVALTETYDDMPLVSAWIRPVS